VKVDNDDCLGRWSSIIVGRDVQLIEIIMFYRIVDSTAKGIMKVHAQYNKVLEEYHSTKYYHSQFLKDLSSYIKRSRTNNKVKDFILIGDINENVGDISIENFMTENGLVNVYKHVNNINANKLDNTYKYGKKCINIVMCTYRLINYVASCQLTEHDEVIINNHRGYLVDLEIERYCKCKLNKYDKPNHTILNNMRKSHVIKFNEKVNLEVSNNSLYWKLKVKHMQGKIINVERIMCRKDIRNVDNQTIIINEAK